MNERDFWQVQTENEIIKNENRDLKIKNEKLKFLKEDFEKRFLTMIKDYKIDEKISDKVIEKVIEDNAKFYGATKEQVKKRAKELGLIKVIYF
jgi:hypothetical protein